jgi:hypothetical protein
VFSLACGHALCPQCAVSYLRDSLGNAQALIAPEGVRCPMHVSGCAHFITAIDARVLLTARDTKLAADIAARGEPLPGMPHPSSAHIEFLRPLAKVLPPSLMSAAERQVARFFGGLGVSSAGSGSGATSSTGDELHLSLDELKRLDRFAIEAAIPEELRRWCPRCTMLVLLSEDKAQQLQQERSERERAGSRGQVLVVRLNQARQRLSQLFCAMALRRSGRARHEQSQDVICPHCNWKWDLRAGAGDASYDERASQAYIKMTSKACPNPGCGQRISHFHGHSCHHISPGTNGCPNCHTHFCFVCLRAHTRDPHASLGYRRHPRCKHGSNYCNNGDITRYLCQKPYPHDRRCGCPICPHCKPRRPCEQCDGKCVVCLGCVPPGPDHVSADPTWGKSSWRKSSWACAPCDER